MSALFRQSGILGRGIISARSAAAVAGRGSGRSMGTATRHDNDPDVLEKNKQSILRKHAKGSTEYPHWHEELASDAEAFVKSYRGEIDSSEGEIAKIQDATKKIPDTKANVKGEGNE